MKNFRWHDLRHTFISRLVMKDVNLRTEQELAGHKTMSMTTRYAHLAPEHNQAPLKSSIQQLREAPLISSGFVRPSSAQFHQYPNSVAGSGLSILPEECWPTFI